MTIRKVTVPKADVLQPRKFGDTGGVVDSVKQKLIAGGIDPAKPFKQEFDPEGDTVSYTQDVPGDAPPVQSPAVPVQPPAVEIPKDTSIPSPPPAVPVPTVETAGAPEDI